MATGLLTTLLKACIAGGILLCAPAVQASSWLEWAVPQLKNAGIRMAIANGCPSRRAAAYRPSIRAIEICASAFNEGEAYLKEVIAHESIHAAQHCAGLISGAGRMMPLSAFLASEPGARETLSLLISQGISGKDRSIVYSMRNDAERGPLELEAYALEEHPTEAVKLAVTLCSR